MRSRTLAFATATLVGCSLSVMPAAPSLALTSHGAPIDLGTLGGTNSDVTAMSGNIIVGNSDMPDGSTHAWAYNLADPGAGLRDLGTLGGSGSGVSAVDGTIAVGSSATSDGAGHAFAVDLSKDTAMEDLGILPGGTYSQAWGVSGSIVVGGADGYVSYDPDHPQQGPFFFDLSNPTAGMQPLPAGVGATFQDLAWATTISGHYVAGSAHYNIWIYDLNDPTTPPHEIGMRHSKVYAADGSVFVGRDGFVPFVYDASNPDAGTVDLGNWGGQIGQAQGVSGNLVVGDSDLSIRPYPDAAYWIHHAFTYDIGKPAAGKQDIGTLGGLDSSATAVNGHIVAGDSDTSDGKTHAFAYDASEPGSGLRDLGTLGGSDSHAVAVNQDGVIAGTSQTAGNTAVHAVVWLPTHADLVIGLVGGSQNMPPVAGRPYIIFAAVTNDGPDAANSSTLTIQPPANAALLFPVPGADGGATLALGAIAPGDTVRIVITVLVSARAGGRSLGVTAEAASLTQDPHDANSSATLSAVVVGRR